MKVALGTVIFSVLVPGAVLVALPVIVATATASLVPVDFGVASALGVLPIALGAGTYVRAATAFVLRGKGTPAPIAAPTEFVATGPYRYVRNPMYVAGLAIVLGEAVLFEAPLVLAYACLLFVAFHLFVVGYEEPNLRRRFGSSYEHYLDQVDRWLPKRPRDGRESA